MKSLAPGFLLGAAGGVGLTVLAWAGTFLYWHVRITRAIGTIDELTQPGKIFIDHRWEQVYDTLTDAGCRSLPYLVNAVDSSRDRHYVEEILYLVCRQAGFSGASDETREFIAKCKFKERNLQGEVLQGWWRREGSAYHRWWMVWTSRCPNCSEPERW